SPLRDARGQRMTLGIAPRPPGRHCLPDEQQQKQHGDTDHHEARPAERIAVQIEWIEAAAQRAHFLAVEQLLLELLGPGREFPFGNPCVLARGPYDEEAVADRERVVGTRLLAARLAAAL